MTESPWNSILIIIIIITIIIIIILTPGIWRFIGV